MSFLSKLKNQLFGNSEEAYASGLQQSNQQFLNQFKTMDTQKAIDDDFYAVLFKALIESDVGLKSSKKLIEGLKQTVKKQKLEWVYQALQAFAQTIIHLFKPYDMTLNEGLSVIVMVGINGSGKTTSAAKLAALLKAQNKKVGLVAADTFRAAAVQQLETWADRLDIPCFKGHPQQDPSSVIVDACKVGMQEAYDVLIIDTAGRLQNKVQLMQELEKMTRVIEKITFKPAQHVFLVLDASTGQNALSQAEAFSVSSKISAIVCTKMDSGAKGGILITLSDQFKLPVAFIGLGEQVTDLYPFQAELYTQTLLRGLYDHH